MFTSSGLCARDSSSWNWCWEGKKKLLMIFPIRLPPTHSKIRSADRGSSRQSSLHLLPFVVCSCKRRSLLRSCHENSKETSEIIREFDTFLVLFVFALHFRDCVDRNANREWWAQWFYASGREIRKQSFTSCIDASLTIHDAPFHCTVMSRVIWNVVTTTNCSQPQQRFKFIGKFHLRNARRKFSDECDSTKDDFIARLSSQYRVRSGKRENALAVFFFFFFFFNSEREKRKA